MENSNWWEAGDFGIYHHTDKEGSGHTRRRVGSLFSAAFNYLDDIGHSPSRVLDAGCGLGFVSALVTHRYAAATVIGSDNFAGKSLANSSINLAEGNMHMLQIEDRVTFIRSDLLAMPFTDGVFDTIVTSLVYHNLGPNMGRGIEELKRLLSGHGILLFGDLFFHKDEELLLRPLMSRREFRTEGKYLKDYRLLVLSSQKN